ncbi:hypothetical protein NQ854_25600 [Rhodococcus ruber]|uniref:hypothetical protein n=1 Tax=Rhodococcus ruber TaxID=1830 RepID=UPI00387DC9EF
MAFHYPAGDRMIAECDGAADLCEILTTLADQHLQRCRDAGIVGHHAVLEAMAVGLVQDVWRNGPVEHMHSSKRGPSDTTMFVESTDLHSHAVKTLTSPDRVRGLLEFERHLPDRDRVWACTDGRTLKELGYGHLGEYTRHVRARTNTMLDLARHTCTNIALESFLVLRAIGAGTHHKGMPALRS